MDKKFTLIIVADSGLDTILTEPPVSSNAQVLLHGRPLFNHVVDAFRTDPRINEIVAVGGEELEYLEGMRHVSMRIPGNNGLIHTFLTIGTAFTRMILPEPENHGGYLIVSADAVLLTPQIIGETITRIVDSNSDFHLHYVPQAALESANLRANRPHVTVQGKNYLPGSIAYIRRFSYTIPLFEMFSDMISGQRSYPGMLKALDLESSSIREIEDQLSSKIRGSFALSIVEVPRLASPVETLDDLQRAQEMVQKSANQFKRGVIIYNPNAGSGFQFSPILLHIMGIKKRKGSESENRQQLIEQAQRYFLDRGINVELQPTLYAGHATELAQSCRKSGYDLIIAAGGDGTINEVINAMVGNPAALGVIPMGTANVFALELNIPVSIEAACEVIVSGEKTTIDLGKAGDRYFSCMAGTGFDAYVIRKADSKFKKILGVLSYPVVAFFEFLAYPFKKITVRIDDQPIPRKGYWVVINNGKYYGGKLPLATYANMQDGYLDVTIFKYRGVIPALIYVLGIWHNRVDRLMSVEQFQCKKIYIEKSHGASIHVDAEYLCEAPIEITVIPQAITVIR